MLGYRSKGGERGGVCFVAGVLCCASLAGAWNFDPGVDDEVVSAWTPYGPQPVDVQEAVPDGMGGAFVLVAQAGWRVQHLSSSGELLWNPAVAVALSAEVGLPPQMVSDQAGGVIVGWDERRNASSDVYVQRISRTGARLWGETGLGVCLEGGEQRNTQLVSDGSGGAILVWNDDRNDPNPLDFDHQWDVYAQRISRDGVPQWTADGVPVYSQPGVSTGDLRATPDGLGGFVVVWSGPGGLRAQRLDGAGQSQWPSAGVLLASQPETQGYARIVSDGQGGALAAWAASGTPATFDNSEIRGQHIGSDGALLWGASGKVIRAADVSFRNWLRDAVEDGLGGMTIVWEREAPGVFSVLVQRIDTSGTLLWDSEGTPLAPEASVGRPVAIEADGAGGVFAAWADGRNCTYVDSICANLDIFAQRLDIHGTRLWGEAGVAVSTVPDGVIDSVVLAPTGHGDVIAVWKTRRLLYQTESVPLGVYAERAPATSHLSEKKRIRIRSEEQGYHSLTYNYTTNQAVIWPFTTGRSLIRETLPPNQTVGMFLYDYQSARFTDAVYRSNAKF